MIDTGCEPALFHPGELHLQRQAGALEQMDGIGRRLIRDHMPDPHRAFFAQLPFLVIGAVDAAGDARATMATGAIGFMTSPGAKTLRVRAAASRLHWRARADGLSPFLRVTGSWLPVRDETD